MSDEKVSAQHIDSAAEFVGDDTTVLTEEQERQCLRRVDFVLMPVMFITMALQYMDKACLTGAAMFGILTDLDLLQISRSGLDMKRYSYATMIFYWGYLLGSEFYLFSQLDGSRWRELMGTSIACRLHGAESAAGKVCQCDDDHLGRRDGLYSRCAFIPGPSRAEVRRSYILAFLSLSISD
jgi:hypothetical protein